MTFAPPDAQQTLRLAFRNTPQAYAMVPVGPPVNVEWNYLAVTYPSSIQEVYTFKTGGSGGTTVKTITVNYTTTAKSFIDTVSVVQMGWIFNPFTGNFDNTGPDNGTIVDTGTYASPITVTATLTVPSDQRARWFIKANASLTAVTTISNGSGTQELRIVGTDNSFVSQFTALSNLVLSGEFRARAGSSIDLNWVPGSNFWLEVGRNEK